MLRLKSGAVQREAFGCSRILSIAHQSLGCNGKHFIGALEYCSSPGYRDAAGTAIFVEIAEHVRSGSTQAFDELVMRWVDTHHLPALDAAMLEITALGTATVVLMIVAIAALFLILTQNKYPAILLLASTFGGLVLNWC